MAKRRVFTRESKIRAAKIFRSRKNWMTRMTKSEKRLEWRTTLNPYSGTGIGQYVRKK